MDFLAVPQKLKHKGSCGVEGVQNVIQSGIQTVDNIVNIRAAKSYKTIADTLTKKRIWGCNNIIFTS